MNRFPPTRCHSAPNGIPPLSSTDDEVKDLRHLFAIPPGKLIIIMTGRGHRYKGVDFILQCMAYLFSLGNKNFHFLFIGEGPDLVLFRKIADKLGIIGNCTFPGQRQDISMLLRGADLAMHPSHGEVGYSLSILEYMRAGLPVVVPNNPSVCGATQHGITGLVYQEGNVQAASSMLLRLESNPELRCWMGEKARIAVQEYSLAKTHKALLEAFEKIRMSPT